MMGWLRRIVFAAAVVAFAQVSVFAEESPEEVAEAAEAAQEDKVAAAMDGEKTDPLKYFIARGKLVLTPGAKKDVIGTFTTPTAAYQLKAENEEVKKDLLKWDGKEVGLGGKIRNKGKYFIVLKIAAQGVQAPMTLSNPAGL